MPINKTGKKNKAGIAQYRVRYNYIDNDGKYRQITKTVYGAAEAKLVEAQLQAKALSAPTKTYTVQNLFEAYMQAQKNEIRESSLDKTRRILTGHVLPFFHNTKLEKLTTSCLQEWKNNLAERPLKISTKQNIFRTFSALLNFAVKMEYIPSNPLQRIGNIKDAYYFGKSEEKLHYYTAEEYKQFIQTIPVDTYQGRNYFTFFSIAFYTGMRKGEINALRWQDISENIITVSRSVTQKIKGKENVFTPPKNASSYRKLQIPKPLLEILSLQKESQQKEFKNWNESFLVCGGDNPLRDTCISNWNIKAAEAAGLTPIRIHDFRHTHATLLINEGISAQEIARRLGHSDVTTTLKVYSHLYPREEERALQILNAI